MNEHNAHPQQAGLRRTAQRISVLAVSCAALAFPPASSSSPAAGDTHGTETDHPLTIVALGDAGESGGGLRGNASYLTDMFTGENDGGTYDVMLFLGNNFSETGLNMRAADVEGEVAGVLDRFRVPFAGLGRDRVHAIPGNHDYYARNAFESSMLFGLFHFESGPVGISDRGNAREAAVEYWTYHSHMPSQALFPEAPGSRDTVQLIFFDSALLLRTPREFWHPVLDSLRLMLAHAREHPGIRWRMLCAHHPFVSVGEHAGYTEWDDVDSVVERVPCCDKDSNAVRWVQNWLDPEDLCAERYGLYIDSVKTALRASGVRVHIMLSAHDHSLQLIAGRALPGDTSGPPPVQIISGAGSTAARVMFPRPPQIFTSAQTDPEKQGVSVPGFVQLRFEGDRVRVRFFSGKTGDPIDMGGGSRTFWISRDGTVTE